MYCALEDEVQTYVHVVPEFPLLSCCQLLKQLVRSEDVQCIAAHDFHIHGLDVEEKLLEMIANLYLTI